MSSFSDIIADWGSTFNDLSVMANSMNGSRNSSGNSSGSSYRGSTGGVACATAKSVKGTTSCYTKTMHDTELLLSRTISDIPANAVIVECDVDGVLLNIYKPIEDYLEYKGKPELRGFKFEDRVRSWGMQELGNLRKDIFELIKRPDLRAKAVWYYGAEDFLYNLYSICMEHNAVLVLNSHESSVDAGRVKLDLLVNLASRLGILPIINVQVSRGSKEMLKSYICIDDCVNNLLRSPASYKFVVSACHNRDLRNMEHNWGYYTNYNSMLMSVNSILEEQV